MSKNICRTCKFRSQCTQLCPVAERYINQDFQRQTWSVVYSDKIEDFSNEDQNKWAEMIVNRLPKKYLSKTQREVVELRNSGRSFKHIAQTLDMTQGNCRVIFHRSGK